MNNSYHLSLRTNDLIKSDSVRSYQPMCILIMSTGYTLPMTSIWRALSWGGCLSKYLIKATLARKANFKLHLCGFSEWSYNGRYCKQPSFSIERFSNDLPRRSLRIYDRQQSRSFLKTDFDLSRTFSLAIKLHDFLNENEKQKFTEK